MDARRVASAGARALPLHPTCPRPSIDSGPIPLRRHSAQLDLVEGQAKRADRWAGPEHDPCDMRELRTAKVAARMRVAGDRAHRGRGVAAHHPIGDEVPAGPAARVGAGLGIAPSPRDEPGALSVGEAGAAHTERALQRARCAAALD
jgi:hypothetical protein